MVITQKDFESCLCEGYAGSSLLMDGVLKGDDRDFQRIVGPVVIPALERLCDFEWQKQNCDTLICYSFFMCQQTLKAVVRFVVGFLVHLIGL